MPILLYWHILGVNTAICAPSVGAITAILAHSMSANKANLNNIHYTISFKLCKVCIDNITYEGETARNGFIRSMEVKKAYEKIDKNSVL